MTLFSSQKKKKKNNVFKKLTTLYVNLWPPPRLFKYKM